MAPPTTAEVERKPPARSVRCRVPPRPPESPSLRPRISASARAGSAHRTLLATCSGIVALAFVGWHVWETSAQRALGRRNLEDLYYDLAASLSGTVAGIPLGSLVYLVGAAAACSFLGSAAFDAWSGDRRKTDGAGGRKLIVTVLACGIYLVFAGTVVEYASGALVP